MNSPSSGSAARFSRASSSERTHEPLELGLVLGVLVVGQLADDQADRQRRDRAAHGARSRAPRALRSQPAATGPRKRSSDQRDRRQSAVVKAIRRPAASARAWTGYQSARRRGAACPPVRLARVARGDARVYGNRNLTLPDRRRGDPLLRRQRRPSPASRSPTVGIILMIVGVIGLLISLFYPRVAPPPTGPSSTSGPSFATASTTSARALRGGGRCSRRAGRIFVAPLRAVAARRCSRCRIAGRRPRGRSARCWHSS